MNPDECIAALDSALADAGQDIVLRRIVGQGAAAINIDVKCRASVRTYRLREDATVGGVAQAVVIVTISPTQIANAQWPGGTRPGQTVSPSTPRRNDRLIIDGRIRNINAVTPVSVGNQAVRFDMQIEG